MGLSFGLNFPFGLFGSLRVNPFQSSTILLKTLWEKDKLLVTNFFSVSHSVFYPFGELSAVLIKFEIVVCKLFQFGPVRNSVIWEGVNSLPNNKFLDWSKFKAFADNKINVN